MRNASSPPSIRPAKADLTAAIAVGSVWIGLTAAYLIPKMPPSFAILAVATATYLTAIGVGTLRRATLRRQAVPADHDTREPVPV